MYQRKPVTVRYAPTGQLSYQDPYGSRQDFLTPMRHLLIPEQADAGLLSSRNLREWHSKLFLRAVALDQVTCVVVILVQGYIQWPGE